MHKTLILALIFAVVALVGMAKPGLTLGVCNAPTTTPVSFGNYDVFSPSDVQTTGSITYTCTSAPTGVIVEMSAGNSADCTTRYLQSGANRLSYSLYLDAAHSQLWGTTAPQCGVTKSDPALIIGGTVTDTIYALLPKSQNAVATAVPYSDTLTVTINF